MHTVQWQRVAIQKMGVKQLFFLNFVLSSNPHYSSPPLAHDIVVCVNSQPICVGRVPVNLINIGYGCYLWVECKDGQQRHEEEAVWSIKG